MVGLTKRILVMTALLALLLIPALSDAAEIFVSDEAAWWIGTRMFYNECSSDPKRLVTWNEGEDFMSLGIGHFIWYPRGHPGPFHESFTELVKYIKENGRRVPQWLYCNGARCCPWSSRQEYLAQVDSGKARELLEFLKNTTDLQLRFIVRRLEATLPLMIAAAPEESRDNVRRQFFRLVSTPAGLYAAVDYVNFKGQGISAEERYWGRGWGLLQVLERMKGRGSGVEAVREFAYMAEKVLIERVWHSPPERFEARWIDGWSVRVRSYLEAVDEDPALLANVNRDIVSMLTCDVVKYPSINHEEPLRKAK